MSESEQINDDINPKKESSLQDLLKKLIDERIAAKKEIAESKDIVSPTVTEENSLVAEPSNLIEKLTSYRTGIVEVVRQVISESVSLGIIVGEENELLKLHRRKLNQSVLDLEGHKDYIDSTIQIDLLNARKTSVKDVKYILIKLISQLNSIIRFYEDYILADLTVNKEDRLLKFKATLIDELEALPKS